MPSEPTKSAARAQRRPAKLRAALLFAAVLAVFPCAASAKPVTIGVSWFSRDDGHESPDESAIRAAIARAGAIYLASNAHGSPAQQAADVGNLIAKGANALIVVASDPGALAPAANEARTKGVAVVAYRQILDSPDSLYVGFDEAEAGRIMAKALLAARPAGLYAFIRGPRGDARSDRIHAGVLETLKPAMGAGKVKTAGEAYVEGWGADGAMAAALDLVGKTRARIDAVVCETDVMAGGVAAALAAEGLTATAVSGVGGDHAAINRVALGTQAVSVWEDASDLGRTAAEAAVALAQGRKRFDIDNAKPFAGPSGMRLEAVLAPPVAITRDDLNVVVDRGWMTKLQICSGVKPLVTPFCG